MMYYYPGSLWWGVSSGIGAVFMILFWIVVVVLVVSLIRSAGWRRAWRDGMHPWDYPAKNTPLDILKERYAKGEITKEQLEQMKKDLAE